MSFKKTCNIVFFSCFILILYLCLVYDLEVSRKSALKWIEPMFTTKYIQSDNEHATYVGGALNSSNCSEKEVNLSDTALPLTGLVSFPGSGNTWTRHLIQQMTGIGTSSVYCDRDLRRLGFPFECEKRKRRTIVVKTHQPKHITVFKKVVLLVRNPYEAMLSFVNFKTSGHTNTSSKEDLIQVSERRFNLSLCWYVNLTRVTTDKFIGPVHILQYENLKKDMKKELRKLATFLNVSVSDHDINCTVKAQEGHYHRRSSNTEHMQLLRTIYNKEKLKRLQEVARLSEKLIKETYDIEVDLGGYAEKLLVGSSD